MPSKKKEGGKKEEEIKRNPKIGVLPYKKI